jgi:hypothetical protein
LKKCLVLKHFVVGMMRYSSDYIRMQQTKISLPRELRASLDRAASASGRSLGEEIRQRLAWTFAEHVVDRDLAGAGKRLWVEAQWIGME